MRRIRRCRWKLLVLRFFQATGTVDGGSIGAAGGAFIGDATGRGIFNTVKGWFGGDIKLKMKWSSRVHNLVRGDKLSPLTTALQAYPAMQLPHTGDPLALTERQTEENLEAWLQAIPSRLEALRHLLTQVSDNTIDWPKDFPKSESSSALVASLHAWATQAWPQTAATTPSSPEKPWHYAQRDGSFIAWSMIADVAMVIGEVIRAGRPSWCWGIDRNPVNISDGMGTVNRVVLISHWRSDLEKQVEIDVEDIVAHTFVKSARQNWYVEDNWSRLVSEALSGGHEGDWLETNN